MQSKRWPANVSLPYGYVGLKYIVPEAQAIADDSKVATLAGHHPSSVVKYTKYGNTFSTLDIVKMIQDSKFEDAVTANKFTEGVRCTQQLFKRMTKEEYQQEVAQFIEKEKKELDAAVTAMKEKYGKNYKDSAASWSVVDAQKYKEAYKRYKNAQDRYRRKAMKKLSQERQKKALEEMKVDDNGDIITDGEEDDISIEMVHQEDSEEKGVVISAMRSMEDARIKRIVTLSSMKPTTLVGLHL